MEWKRVIKIIVKFWGCVIRKMIGGFFNGDRKIDDFGGERGE